ncbi:MAG: hypothetical protein ACLQO6_13915 [Desulfomonilaceae bacterium]
MNKFQQDDLVGCCAQTDVKFHSYRNLGGNGPTNLKVRLGVIIKVEVPWANIFPDSSVTRSGGTGVNIS